MSGTGAATTFDEQTAGFEAFAAPTEDDANPIDKPAAEAAVEGAEVDKTSTTEVEKLSNTEEVAEAETPEGEETEETVETPEEVAAAKHKKTAAQRVAEIKAATRELREAQRTLEATRRDLATKPDLTAEQQAVTSETDKEPDPTDEAKYPYGELDRNYTKDLAKFEVRQELKAAAAVTAKAQETAKNAEYTAQAKTKFDALVVKGAEKYDDFNEVVVEGAQAGDWQLSPTMAQLCIESDVGQDIAYHLASNPKEAREVFGKSPLAQAAYFGRLEAKFSSTSSDATAKPAVKTTAAPPPVKPARGAGSKTGSDPANESFAETEARWRASQTRK